MSVIKQYKFYSKDNIESEAHKLLLRMKRDDWLPKKWSDLASSAAEFLELRILYETIENDAEGLIVAKIEPTDRRITFNQSFLNQENEGFKQSTIGHEIGHWILHINQDEADGYVQQLELPLQAYAVEAPFLCRTTKKKLLDKVQQRTQRTQHDWREWQAQYFAACLLMPRFKLEEVQKGRELTKWPHLYAITEELGVTISNLTNRLQDLGLIYIPKGSKQIYRGKPKATC